MEAEEADNEEEEDEAEEEEEAEQEEKRRMRTKMSLPLRNLVSVALQLPSKKRRKTMKPSTSSNLLRSLPSDLVVPR